MAVLLDQEVRIVKELRGEPFYGSTISEAFRKAKKFAGKKGFVATWPDLVNGRIVAIAEDKIWTDLYTPNSEELVGTTSQGNRVFIVDHDIVVLTPKFVEEALKDPEKITPQYAAKLTDQQVRLVLSGKRKPVFSFEELKKQTVLPRSYTVVIDFDVAKRTPSDYQDADRLPENPIFVARAGTVEQATQYVKKAKIVHNTDKLGNWHSLNSIDPVQPQGRVPYFGSDGGGFYGGSISRYARPVGVAPEALVGRAKNGVAPKLEKILSSAKPFVSEASWNDFQRTVSTLYE